ncbi:MULTISPECIES: MtnX-like HAD-IB family phosphatase [unclassified Brevundimonas]|uniref:MtnX-like HAD-IB family phosphatase n=1 Tax=unclassified Brevundimonas TaxID=2622653 RepID=UPI003F9109EA
MRIICDFDGTITTTDTTDQMLEALADPEWRTLEARWVAGDITAAECMRQQIALLPADDGVLDAVLDQVDLDPGFPAFIAFCAANALPVGVVSDGVDYFIHRILARHGFDHLPLVANGLTGRKLKQPWRREGCAAGSGVCKCAAVAASAPSAKTRLVFIGDGRSDYCVSTRADILFAKGQLAEYATERGWTFIAFDTFHDVTATLSGLLAQPRVRADA